MPPDFRQTQAEFTQWLRHPSPQALPTGILPARMETYRELLFNNVISFVDITFPVTQALLPSVLWLRLKEHFFADHHCQSPFFYDISLHFREFVGALDWPELADYPWLTELLHYEWMELAADIAEAPNPSTEPSCVLADDSCWTQVDAPIRLAMPVWPLAYQWPVADWSVETESSSLTAQAQCVLLWRNRDDHVRALTVEPLAAWLIENIQQAEPTLNGLTTALMAASPDITEALALSACQRVLQQLQASGIAFLG